jgi:parallel beta-helix repeat protein
MQIHLRKFAFLLLLLFALPLWADYTTPGNGTRFDADSLVAVSGGAVTGSNGRYQINATVTVSLSDTLSLQPGDTLIFTDTSGNRRLLINGAFLAIGTSADSIVITSANRQPGDYYGLEYRDIGNGSAFEMQYCRIEFATRAIDVVDADVVLKHCLIRRSGEVAIDLFSSNSLIENCIITENRQRAITMTVNSSPIIRGCLFTENNYENISPYTIISIGLQGVNSPQIIDNHIIGGYAKSGGISIWNSSNALISGNIIENCGYGILCFSVNANPRIVNNIIRNNNINPDTTLWGFGIASNGSNAPVIAGNEIYGHFYGVAIVNGGQPNLGNLNNADTTDDGRNYFLGNGIGNHRYELFNNNALPIFAENNWWGTADPDSIEDRIVHKIDDDSYGLVDFLPYISSITGLGEPAASQAPTQPLLVTAYPNPFNPATTLQYTLERAAFVRVEIFNTAGQRVTTLLQQHQPAGVHRLRWDGTAQNGIAVSSGVYLYRISAGTNSRSGKLFLLK